MVSRLRPNYYTDALVRRGSIRMRECAGLPTLACSSCSCVPEARRRAMHGRTGALGRPLGPDNGVSGSSACDADDNVEAETSSSNGTRRIADSSAVQAASINVVGEKRTPADVGLWDRRHQRASSEEPEEMEPRSLYAYGMRAAGGDGNPDASRGRRAGAAAMPRHHRHVRARLSIEPLSGTSESISERQRGDGSNGVQSQSAVGSDATDAAAE